MTRAAFAGRWAAFVLLCGAAAGCGKKGPPLAPIVRVPAGVGAVEARRLGDEVYLTLTVPNQNIDSTMPADLTRVEVYGITAEQPVRTTYIEGGALVAVIPVAPAPPVDRRGRPLPMVPSVDDATKASQGAVVTVREALDPGDLVAVVQRPRATRPPARGAQAAVEPQGQLRRFYMAVAFGPRDRPSPPGPIAALPLGPLPEPPGNLEASYTAEAIALRWEPSGGLIGFLLDRALPAEQVPVDGGGLPIVGTGATAGAGPLPIDLPPGPTRYNVYREMAPDPGALPAAPRGDWESAVPAPVNAAPLDVLTFSDPVVLDERQRCYRVHPVRGSAPGSVEGRGARICVTPIDILPPAAPTGLSAAAVDGTIELIWDPVADADVAGYLVLRGAPGDAVLTPLTEQPMAAARFVDRAIQRGRSYVYAVVAVDDRLPLGNLSPESSRVQETAR